MKQARQPELTALSKKLLEDSEKYFAEGNEPPECEPHKTYTVTEIKEKGLIDVGKIMKQKKRPGM